MNEQDRLSSDKVHDLREHSIADNIKYIKENDGELYECLIKIVRSSFKRYNVMKEAIDEKDEFHVMLETLKRFVPAAVLSKYDNPNKSPAFQSMGLKFPIPERELYRLDPIVNIFEWMFLNIIEQSEFNDLDPKIQDLYLEAQKLIDDDNEETEQINLKEIRKEIMSRTNESITNKLNKVKDVIMDRTKRDELNGFISVEIAQAVARIVGKVQELDQRPVLKTGTVKKCNLLKVYDNQTEIFNRYWNGDSEETIACDLDLSYQSVIEFLTKELPINLVHELYNQGMYPSKIARKPEIKLTTNQVRRILQMPFV